MIPTILLFVRHCGEFHFAQATEYECCGYNPHKHCRTRVKNINYSRPKPHLPRHGTRIRSYFVARHVVLGVEQSPIEHAMYVGNVVALLNRYIFEINV